MKTSFFSRIGAPVFQKIIWDPDGPRKVQVVENTQIKFNKKELLQLIDAHLREEGLHKAAEALRSEANIKPVKLQKNFKSPVPNRPRRNTNDDKTESGKGEKACSLSKPGTKRYPRINSNRIQFSRR